MDSMQTHNTLRDMILPPMKALCPAVLGTQQEQIFGTAMYSILCKGLAETSQMHHSRWENVL